MTTKEKAKELVDLFRMEAYREEITTADFNPEREAYRYDVAKRCAIVCVDEIISLLPSAIPVLESVSIYNDDYWVIVKEEIKKL